MMNNPGCLVTTLLVMTSTLVAAEEAKGLLTLTPQRVIDRLTPEQHRERHSVRGRSRPRPVAASPACWWM